MSHPRYNRYKKSRGYVLAGKTRKAINDRIMRMVVDGPTSLFMRHLQLEFGKDAVSAYREEVLG